jgi:phage portal protein BeeE
MFGWLRRAKPPAPETRSGSAAGYTAAILEARASYLRGASGLAEMTGTAQACVSLWEAAFATADVQGDARLDRACMAMIGRALALRGEAVFLIRPDRLVPAADWDLSTRNGQPRAYRVQIAEAGGGRSETALAAEVLHLRIGADPIAPWAGTPPLRRAQLSAQLLHELEAALRDVFADAPLGSQLLPLPEGLPEDVEAMRRAFRGRRGSVLIVEGAAAATAGGFNPQLGQRREDLSPDLQRAAAAELLRGAQGQIAMAFGLLPAALNPSATGPVIREAQRHLAQWTLEPIGKLIAAEAARKLGRMMAIDLVRPLQAFDQGGKARAVSALIRALAEAQAAGIDPAAALRLVDLSEDGQAVA